MQTTLRRSLLRGLWMPFALLAGGLFVPSAHAQTSAPRAGTSIGNKASATYSDGTGVVRSTQSNTVSTTVSAVPAVDLSDDRFIRAYPSAPVYFAHSVQNTGNAPDSFALSTALASGQTLSGLTIYADANGDGRPDSATPISVTSSLQPGETFNFVVAGRVTDGAASGATDTLNVKAVSLASAAALDNNLDTLTISTNANVVLRKSVSVSGGAPGDGQTYTYTLSYVNNSQVDAGQTVISDVFPSRLAYLAGSAKWNQGNTALTDASDAPEATVNGSTINYSFDGSKVSATLFKIAAQSQGTISFSFSVPATAAPSAVPNTARPPFWERAARSFRPQRMASATWCALMA